MVEARKTVTWEQVAIATVKTSPGKQFDEGNLVPRPPNAKRRRCEKYCDPRGARRTSPKGQGRNSSKCRRFEKTDRLRCEEKAV